MVDCACCSGDTRFQAPDTPHETITAHQPIPGCVRIFKWLDDEYFRVAAEPRNRKIGQNPYDRRGDAVERDAPADHTRIGAKSFAPEVLRNQADIIPHFFLLKKIAAENRMNAQQIEIICGDVLAQHLCWFAKAGQDVTVAPIGGYTRKNRLPVPIMPELWD